MPRISPAYISEARDDKYYGDSYEGEVDHLFSYPDIISNLVGMPEALGTSDLKVNDLGRNHPDTKNLRKH